VRRLVALGAALAALGAAGTASAHPLGNFTVNRYSGIELSGDRVYVHYALDLAEIPTFQEGDAVRATGFADRLARGLRLRIDGRRVAVRAVEHTIGERPGAGGLPTLRFQAVFETEGAVATAGRMSHLAFEDTNYASRIGWNEVVVTAESGAEIHASTAPAASVSDALRAYPKELLEAPLDVSSATVSFTPGSHAGGPPELGASAVGQREGGGFESLVAREDLGLGVVLVSLGIAMFWGAAHALTPGHGKAIVAGYLVGSRGRPHHALLLGLIVTVTHTIGVFVLGVVTLVLAQFVVPERLYPWLTLASGLLVVAVGASLFWKRLRHRPRAHTHGHHHRHDHGRELSARGLLGIGAAAGLLPCPSALVVLLSAVALHRIGFGLALIVAFSVGLAATISSIGLVAVLAQRAFSRLRLDGPVFRALPAASALLILAVGIGIAVKSLPEVF
jgi:nickel/cobalt exporter